MKKAFSLLAAVALVAPGAQAMISVPRDFPTSYLGSNGEATGKSQLPNLVAYYQNEVVLLANPEKQYSETIQKTVANPDVTKKLEAAAAASGKLSEEALAAAVTKLVQENPDQAPQIVASALYILGDIPGGLSSDNRKMIAQAAILGVPSGRKDTPLLTARIIGVALRGTDNGTTPSLVRSLRTFAIASISNGSVADKTADSTLSLDEAMMAEGIISPYGATEDFLRLAASFDPEPQQFVDGLDAGGANAASLSGFGGSGGGGNSGDTVPTPTPTPEPSPSS